MGKERMNAFYGNQNIVALELHEIFGETAVIRIDSFARTCVEGPLMSPARKHAPIEFSFNEPNVVVRTNALKAARLAAFGTYQHYHVAIHFHLGHLRFPQVIESTNFPKPHVALNHRKR
ncbi:hypothetical protein OKW50_007816 [Paraburkholderia youngii]